MRPSKASILGALSQALDLVEGQPEGHALRTAQIALKIGETMGLSNRQREDLYFAAVLKDSGCSNNSVRIQQIFGGDEHLSKRAVKFIDWTSPAQSLKFAWQHTEAGRSLAAKLRRMASNIGSPNQVMNAMTEARCTRGAAIANMLSLNPAVADAILYLDEHWDGKGAPYQLAGDKIPILSRILCFAQTFEVFLACYGLEESLDMAAARSGRWFDPEVVQACVDFADDNSFLESIGDPSFVERELPELAGNAIESDIDAICEAFAMIVDAKSNFTSEHSTRVMQYSVLIAEHLGFDKARLSDLRRAALLHDIGKLGVPSGILEKPGRLDPEEFERVTLHPKFGHEILGRIPSFEYMAEIASAHHERLDGKGYWRGLGADDLSLDVRIVTACDVFDALSATRPYRAAMPLEKVWSILDSDIGTAFDGDCVAALKECIYDVKLVDAA
ncbi:MAG: HD domain-containing protein [Fimbriimonadaceae bacterium]|nr:HD domain-containing protein [Fimbriimonadaceae bacterium]